jgi:hypothetical protein
VKLLFKANFFIHLPICVFMFIGEKITKLEVIRMDIKTGSYLGS